jgi:hypothetical protein
MLDRAFTECNSLLRRPRLHLVPFTVNLGQANQVLFTHSITHHGRWRWDSLGDRASQPLGVLGPSHPCPAWISAGQRRQSLCLLSFGDLPSSAQAGCLPQLSFQ